MDPIFREIYAKSRPYSLTSTESLYSIYKATEYVARYRIPGSIVECGVWRGGAMMVSALTLLSVDENKRDLCLYDTFDGMTAPSEKDVNYDDEPAQGRWARLQGRHFNKWCRATLGEVKRNLLLTGYPQDHMMFVKGRVEDTIPAVIPPQISILRLDTDWYESTYHALSFLFPRLSRNGVLILDDYGCWRGARRAADKYFAENKTQILLNRIDYTERVGMKVKS
jgi:hypothetical protein